MIRRRSIHTQYERVQILVYIAQYTYGSGAPPPLSADTPATEPETHPCSPSHRRPPIHRAAASASDRLRRRGSSRLRGGRGGRRLSDGGGGAQHSTARCSVLSGRRTALLAVAVRIIHTVGCVVDHCAAIASRRQQPRGRPHTYSSRGLVGAHAYTQQRHAADVCAQP